MIMNFLLKKEIISEIANKTNYLIKNRIISPSEIPYKL